MSILIAYASKHGATEGIAERIGKMLTAAGQKADVRPAKAVDDVSGYDAFVIGSAAYIGSWLKEATEFVRHNQAILATKPVWLFSSGPVGTAVTDAQGRDVLVAAEPKEFVEFKDAIKPRGTRVFFGAVDPSALGFSERIVRRMPAARALLPEGDFRDWKAIETWAQSIAEELKPVPAGTG
ncbi:MAG TPA: flavodoxin domain-containing protein [Candidatus Sulfotelmatobacter sp.]|nr:flavodoxin domain-containing protein [Candidatus Sulfotelmatobacter sp.]